MQLSPLKLHSCTQLKLNIFRTSIMRIRGAYIKALRLHQQLCHRLLGICNQDRLKCGSLPDDKPTTTLTHGSTTATEWLGHILREPNEDHQHLCLLYMTSNTAREEKDDRESYRAYYQYIVNCINRAISLSPAEIKMLRRIEIIGGRLWPTASQPNDEYAKPGLSNLNQSRAAHLPVRS